MTRSCCDKGTRPVRVAAGACREICRAEVPIGLCDGCGSMHWNQAAEAIVEDVVRREYEDLPRRDAIPTDGNPDSHRK